MAYFLGHPVCLSLCVFTYANMNDFIIIVTIITAEIQAGGHNDEVYEVILLSSIGLLSVQDGDGNYAYSVE